MAETQGPCLALQLQAQAEGSIGDQYRSGPETRSVSLAEARAGLEWPEQKQARGEAKAKLEKPVPGQVNPTAAQTQRPRPGKSRGRG